METEHAAYIQKRWPGQMPKVRVLGIPDIYEPDDEDLRDRLTGVVRGLLAEAPRRGPLGAGRGGCCRGTGSPAWTAASSSPRLNGLTR